MTETASPKGGAAARIGPRPAWPLPPRPTTEAGEPRRLGLEIEFAGMTVADAADIVRALWGGRIDARARHDMLVETDRFGEVHVALDTRHAAHKADQSELSEAARALFGDVASIVVPVEITMPPIPLADAPELDRLSAALRAAGAEGTRAGLAYAFGTQLNVEAWGTGPADILATLRAYFLLEDWLREEIEVDRARSLLGFETAHPLAYQRLVLDPGYAPDPARLAADYIDHNPTRNRGLDLLPILAHLDAEAVAARLPEEKIKARPAYHYRLPNSAVEDPAWSPRLEWLRWLRLERLAVDAARLAEAAAERVALLDRPLAPIFAVGALRDASIALGRTL